MEAGIRAQIAGNATWIREVDVSFVSAEIHTFFVVARCECVERRVE